MPFGITYDKYWANHAVHSFPPACQKSGIHVLPLELWILGMPFGITYDKYWANHAVHSFPPACQKSGIHVLPRRLKQS